MEHMNISFLTGFHKLQIFVRICVKKIYKNNYIKRMIVKQLIILHKKCLHFQRNKANKTSVIRNIY